MILECEMCATRYLVDTADIGVLGRMVRCAECGHDWFATTDGAKVSPKVAPVAAPAPAAPTQAPTVEDEAVGQPVAPTEDAAPRGSTNLPAIVPETNDRAARLILFIGAMVLALLTLYLVFGRAQIIAVWPPAQHAFAVLGLEKPVKATAKNAALSDIAPAAMSLQDMQIERIGSTITFTGFVRNDGGMPGPLPSLQIVEYDAVGEAVSTVVIVLEADVEEIAPGESVPLHLVHGLVDAAIERVRLSITD